MKYFVDFLAQLKKREIYPVYLFYGPETYLREQAIRRLREYVLPPGGDELNYDVLDGSTVTGKDIITTASFSPFISGQRLVVVRNTDIFQAAAKKEADAKYILEYLSDPSPGTCLVFETSQKADRRKKVYKESVRVGKVLEFSRLKPAELIKWMAKLANEAECSLSRDAAGELLARCGQDMNTLCNEINKLACYTGPRKQIDIDMVKELVVGHLEESIFEVVDAIGEKNIVRALAGTRNLLLQKHQPQQIIGMVARQFRLIMQIKGLAEARYAREEIIATLKIHPFVYKKIYAQRKNFSIGQLVRALNNLNEIDYKIKTGQAAFHQAMETYILKICAEK